MGLKPNGPLGIVGHALSGPMLITIQLNDQPRLRAEEIGNVGTNRLLSPESKARNLFVAEYRPKLTRRTCEV